MDRRAVFVGATVLAAATTAQAQTPAPPARPNWRFMEMDVPHDAQAAVPARIIALLDGI